MQRAVTDFFARRTSDTSRRTRLPPPRDPLTCPYCKRTIAAASFAQARDVDDDDIGMSSSSNACVTSSESESEAAAAGAGNDASG